MLEDEWTGEWAIDYSDVLDRSFMGRVFTSRERAFDFIEWLERINQTEDTDDEWEPVDLILEETPNDERNSQ